MSFYDQRITECFRDQNHLISSVNKMKSNSIFVGSLDTPLKVFGCRQKVKKNVIG